jgi:hypothetical protein
MKGRVVVPKICVEASRRNSGYSDACVQPKDFVMSLASFDETEGDRLREAYGQADKRFTSAVREMNHQRKTADCEDFKALAQRAHEVRTETAAALHALNLFESEHPKTLLTYS